MKGLLYTATTAHVNNTRSGCAAIFPAAAPAHATSLTATTHKNTAPEAPAFNATTLTTAFKAQAHGSIKKQQQFHSNGA